MMNGTHILGHSKELMFLMAASSGLKENASSSNVT
jgi:hypothetical protein